MAAATQERLIRLWASPQGAPKAALLAARKTNELGPNPSVGIADGVMTSGSTSVAWEGGKPVVTFPIPGVPGATASATLDAKYMAEKVVVKQGTNTIEFTYGDYRDWNNPLNLIDAFYAGKMTERRNGAVVRDITTTETETGSVYVVMPVPASVKKAITPTLQVPSVEPPTVTLAASQTTPRLANGKPDMTGNWNASGMNWRYGNRRCGPTQVECTRAINQTADFEFEAPSRFGPSRPLYKPEHWDKVIELDMWTNKYDPVMTCQPLGIPRQGPPRRIVQSDKDIIFFYSAVRRRRRRAGRISHHPDRRPQAQPEPARDHLLRANRRALGRRHAGARVDPVRGHHVAGARRLLPLRRYEGRGEAHARGQRDQVRSDGRGSRGARGAVGDDAEDPAAQRPMPMPGSCPSAATARSTNWKTSRHRFATRRRSTTAKSAADAASSSFMLRLLGYTAPSLNRASPWLARR